MKCPMCGMVFEESDGRAACSGCIVKKKCGFVRCPNCMYEIVPDHPKKSHEKDESDHAAE